MHQAILLLTICAGVVLSTNVTNPGLQIRFAQHGLDQAAKVVVDDLAKKVIGSRFLNINGRSGRTTYRVWNIVIRRFTKPTSSVVVTPGSGLTWSASGALVRFTGNWRFKRKISFFRIRESGTFEIAGSGISLSMSVKMGKDSSGRPTINPTATRCSSRIRNLRVRIRGSWLSWLIRLFRGRITRFLKDRTEKLLCSSPEKAINEDLNKQLSELKVVGTISNEFVFNYSLIRDPVFGAGYVQTMHKGEVHAKSNPQPYSSAPAIMEEPKGPTKMVYIWGSEHVINSYAFTAFRMSLAQYNFSGEDLRPSERDILHTTCPSSSVCIGTFFPIVSDTYPNRVVSIRMRAVSAPYIRITPSGINLTLAGEISLNADSPSGESDSFLRIGMNLAMSVNVWQDNHLVKGNITSFRPEVRVHESLIDRTTDTFQILFEVFISPFITEKLDELGAKGIEIPTIPKINFANSVVQLNEGSVMFATDIDWKTLV